MKQIHPAIVLLMVLIPSVRAVDVGAADKIDKEPRPRSQLQAWDARVVEADSVGRGYEAEKVLDGDPMTFWHTAFMPKPDPMPHYVIIDLGATRELSGFIYTPRQDMTNGRVGKYIFYVGQALDEWNEPAAQGAFPNNTATQWVRFERPQSGRYIRLLILSEVQRNPFASVAELDVLTPSDAPEDDVVCVVTSPTEAAQVSLRLRDGMPFWEVAFGKNSVLQESALGMTPASGPYGPLKTTGIAFRQHDDRWKPVWGKASSIRDHYQEGRWTLEEIGGLRRRLAIVIRAYDNGVALRYEFPGKGEETYRADLTTFNFPGDLTCWSANGEHPNHGPVALSEYPGRQMPLTVKVADDCYASLLEGAIESFAAINLKRASETSFQASMGASTVTLPAHSSWRVVLLGKTPGDLLVNHTLVNLNPPCRIEDTSWIRPGLSMWDWRAWGAKTDDGFTYGLDMESWKRHIDFAAKHKLGYLLLDAGWYGLEFDPNEDPTTSRDHLIIQPHPNKPQLIRKPAPANWAQPIDVPALIQYGKERGVGIILYMNDAAQKNHDLEETLATYSKWGAAGIKYGFMRDSGQAKVLKTRRIVELCARNKLLCNFHDQPIPPSGDCRTYPNYVTREFCHSQSDALRAFSPRTFCTTVFTNMLAGSLDMLNGLYFIDGAKAVRPKIFAEVYTTVTAETARVLITYSGFSGLPDIPEAYEAKADLFEFIARLPMTWDETRILNGEIGRHITTARRSSEEWFIASCCDERGAVLPIGLDFLIDGVTYEATLYEDGKDAHYKTNREAYRVRKIDVRKGDVIQARLAPGGGHCIYLRPKAPAATGADVASPNGRISASFKVADFGTARACPSYSISFDGKPIVTASRLGFDLDGIRCDAGLRIIGTQKSQRDETWTPVYGERNEVRDHCNQLDVVFRHMGGSGVTIRYEIRAHDAGVAWQAIIDRPVESGSLTIGSEHTEFLFAEDHACWTTSSAQGAYRRVPLSEVGNAAERPLTVEVGPQCFAAVGEAALVDAARMKLAAIKGKTGVVSRLDGAVVGNAPYTMPWRFVMIGESPGKLLENNDLLLNLNDPCAIPDTSWIRPGKVIREISLTTAGGKSLVDFAVKHRLEYVHFDAGWYGHEYSNESDASTVTVDPKRSPGPLDLHEVIRYATERDIGVIVYVNRRALEKQLDQILPLYRRWGIQGVKYGFVNVGSQKWTSWLHEAIREAAEHRLMVNVHDEYRPTGYSRTYPNLMTQEGIRGDESRPSAEQTLTILFTRMLAGAGDNTVCYFDPRVDELWSHAYQLAKAVCIYSPWQYLYWYDRPAMSPQHVDPSVRKRLPVITEEPELEFFDALPATWDDTKVIHGCIGEYAVIARRSGDEWFVGCMNGGKARRLPLPLEFLDASKTYTARIYSDDQSLENRTKVRLGQQNVSAASTLTIELPANGGQALHLVPER